MDGSGRRVEYLAECYWAGVTEAEIERLTVRARASALATIGTDAEVRFGGSILMPADEVVLCRFAGPSVEAVEAVAGRAGVPFERIVESIHFTSGDDPRSTRQEGMR